MIRRRLHQQQISSSRLSTPAEVVQWLGAVQAQDYLGSLWGIGLRMKEATQAAVEAAISAKTIVRTWPMRGTLHFVTPRDVRWMQTLLTPRIIARSAGLYKQLGLDKRTLAKSRRLLIKALQGGRQLNRMEMYSVLENGKIATGDQRALHIIGHLAQEGLLCLGVRKGKQHTFTLLDEWIPSSLLLKREEALGELARRYFTSHGPALISDFSWWSGLTLADAKVGLELAKSELEHEGTGPGTYWMAQNLPEPTRKSSIHLLPAYDEYTVAYKNRSAFLDPAHVTLARGGIFSPVILVNGKIAGTWRRTIEKDKVIVETDTFSPVRIDGQVVKKFREFVGKEIEIKSRSNSHHPRV